MRVTFDYTAIDAQGKPRKGQVMANSQANAFQQLMQEQLEPLTLTLNTDANTRSASSSKLPMPVQARLFRKLHLLAKAQAPLLECLTICARQEQNPKAKKYIDYLTKQVGAGARLSDAITEDDQFKSRLVHALVLTAEHSGDFADGFKQIADTLEAQYANAKNITQQMIYPAILGLFVVLTVFFVSFMVLPEFEDIFNQSDVSVPLFTAVVLKTGQWIREWGLFLPLALIVGVGCVRYMVHHNAEQVDRILVSLPVIGKLIQWMNAERLTRALGSLLKGGVPLAHAFDIANNVIGNASLAKAAHLVSEQVKQGKRFYVAAQEYPYLPEEVVSLIEVGEKTGQLGAMLVNAAELCQHDTEHQLKKITTIMGPLMTAIAGGIIALVIAAILTGILNLNETIY